MDEIISKLQIKPSVHPKEIDQVLLKTSSDLGFLETKNNDEIQAPFIFFQNESESFNRENIMKHLESQNILPVIDIRQKRNKIRFVVDNDKKKNIPVLDKTTQINPAVQIKDADIASRIHVDRLPQRILPKYYLNNHKKFIQFINTFFGKEKEQLLSDNANITCDTISNTSSSFNILIHQKIVKDYMNLYTPYTGLLLYHGLGSGKTCSSITIAEGMRSLRQTMILAPASLIPNYKEEIKKCGNEIYHRNQFWEWISVTDYPNAIDSISLVLNLPKEYIIQQKGAWLINAKKQPNYHLLTDRQKDRLEQQIDRMIDTKYRFIAYNGLNRNIMSELTANNTKNPFDGTTVIIDEVHNFVSRIVNKLKKISTKTKSKKPKQDNALPTEISTQLYFYLMSAVDCKKIALSGTPIINYPNEFAILFNILRGFIKTWSFPIEIQTSNTVNNSTIRNMLLNEKYHDYVDYNSSTSQITITQNPNGFKNVPDLNPPKYAGVTNNDKGVIFTSNAPSDKEFEENIKKILKDNGIKVKKAPMVVFHKPLPDNLEQFIEMYVDDTSKKLINEIGLQKRILGLTSYFRSAQESLLPRFDKKSSDYYQILKIPMSDEQFVEYAKIRKEERKKKRKKVAPVNGLYEDSTSNYRIHSRLACNFSVKNRPFPKKDKGEVEYDSENEDNEDDILSEKGDTTYKMQLEQLVKTMRENPEMYFTDNALIKSSPKYLELIKSIRNPTNVGLHLIYSQFRTLEGITLISEMLKFNGYAEFKIAKNTQGEWFINVSEEDKYKPKYALYTGTEKDVENKEYVRHIYNGEWDQIPRSLKDALLAQQPNNNLGEIIKIFMITSAGSEGINLRNTRFVHIIEPHWHPVRIEQVIGRARRICSHNSLPEELRTVQAFIYVMVLSETQKKDRKNVELLTHDVSKLVKNKVISSDEYLLEISDMKEVITNQLTDVIKHSAFDCNIYGNEGCLDIPIMDTTGNENLDEPYVYTPKFEEQRKDIAERTNLKIVEKRYVRVTPVNTDGMTYVYNDMDRNKSNRNVPVYDVASVQPNPNGDPIVPVYVGYVQFNGEDAVFTRA